MAEISFFFLIVINVLLSHTEECKLHNQFFTPGGAGHSGGVISSNASWSEAGFAPGSLDVSEC